MCHFQEIRKYLFVKIGCRTSFIPFIWKFQTEGFPEAHVLSPQLKCKIKSITLIICLYLSKLLCLFKSGHLQGGAGKRGPSFLFSFPLFLLLPGPKWLWPLFVEKWQGPMDPHCSSKLWCHCFSTYCRVRPLVYGQVPKSSGGGWGSGTRRSVASLASAFGLFLSTYSKMLTCLQSLLARHTSIQKYSMWLSFGSVSHSFCTRPVTLSGSSHGEAMRYSYQ